MKRISLAAGLLAAAAVAAPLAAQALSYDEAYASGALYAVTCAKVQGRVTRVGAAQVLIKTLEEKGIPTSYTQRPAVQAYALQMYKQNGGC